MKLHAPSLAAKPPTILEPFFFLFHFFLGDLLRRLDGTNSAGDGHTSVDGNRFDPEI